MCYRGLEYSADSIEKNVLQKTLQHKRRKNTNINENAHLNVPALQVDVKDIQ